MSDLEFELRMVMHSLITRPSPDVQFFSPWTDQWARETMIQQLFPRCCEKRWCEHLSPLLNSFSPILPWARKNNSTKKPRQCNDWLSVWKGSSKQHVWDGSREQRIQVAMCTMGSNILVWCMLKMTHLRLATIVTFSLPLLVWNGTGNAWKKLSPRKWISSGYRLVEQLRSQVCR